MTKITSAPKERPNPYLAEIKGLCADWKSAGQKTPEGFATMLEHLLRLTVMKPGSPGLKVQRGKSNKNDFQISGQLFGVDGKPQYSSLLLNNGYYLYILYNLTIDPTNKEVHTVTSKIRYSASPDDEQQVFRFDYERNPASHYPSAHLHIYGELPKHVVLTRLTKKGEQKSLHHIHFPVIRPTLESVIRLLINDYEVEANQDPLDWAPVLDYTESEFFDLFSPGRSQDASPPYVVVPKDK